MSRHVRLPKTRSANTNMNALEENWVRVWVGVRVYVGGRGGGGLWGAWEGCSILLEKHVLFAKPELD